MTGTTFLEKKDVVDYVLFKHKAEKREDISPLKLQKTLYLLYAMWGGNALLINSDIEKGDKTIELTEKLPVDLFEPNFEAWKYGPVDPEVYHNFKSNRYQGEDNITNKNRDNLLDTVISFIDSILKQVFEINDFSLVALSHEDRSWKDAYESPDKKMAKDNILDEYYQRFLLKKNA